MKTTATLPIFYCKNFPPAEPVRVSHLGERQRWGCVGGKAAKGTLG